MCEQAQNVPLGRADDCTPTGGAKSFRGGVGQIFLHTPGVGVQKMFAAEGPKKIEFFVKIVLKNAFFVHISKKFRLRR